MLSVSVEAVASLGRATELLWSAGQLGVDYDDLPQLMVQDGIRMLVWQAADLLPDPVQFSDVPSADASLLVVLERVEAQLRARPIWEYPAGTSRLVVAVCDLVAQARAQSRS